MKGFACEQKKYRFNTISETKSNTVHWKYTTCKDGDSYFKICFLNFELKIHFFGKFGPEKSNLFILLGNWHTWYIEDADSYSKFSFRNFKT